MGQFMTSEYIGFYAHIGNVHTIAPIVGIIRYIHRWLTP